MPVIQRHPDGAVPRVGQDHRNVVTDECLRDDRPRREPALTTLDDEEALPRPYEKTVGHLASSNLPKTNTDERR
jgi:hypothetical protein